VIQADGGTRTAAITGAAVALALGVHGVEQRRHPPRNPVRHLPHRAEDGLCEPAPAATNN